VGVDAHRRAIDHQILVVAGPVPQTGVQRLPEAVALPRAERGIDRLPGAKQRRQVAPPGAGAQDPKDRFES
jgi:hypothetical protein